MAHSEFSSDCSLLCLISRADIIDVLQICAVNMLMVTTQVSSALGRPVLWPDRALV